MVKNFVVTQGESFSTEIVKQESELTADMIQTYVLTLTTMLNAHAYMQPYVLY